MFSNQCYCIFFLIGNVEIFHNGAWGSICDDEWDMKDATVVCKQLGFGGVEKITHGSHFGPAAGKNSGRIFLVELITICYSFLNLSFVNVKISTFTLKFLN